MSLLRRLLVLLFVLVMGVPTFAQDVAATALDGYWHGALKVSGVELRLMFEFKKDDKGVWGGVLTSIDQGNAKIPVGSVEWDGTNLKFEIPAIGGSFDGRLDAGKISGQWIQAGNKLPLVLEHRDEAFTLNRPQEPKPPFPYRSEDLSYPNPDAKGVTLAGTLTLPEGKLSAAVVLVSGSGPQDRNESLMGHKPFLVLADHLTRKGIAVLRFDDRGVGGSTGDPASATTDDFVTDALAGVAYLKTRAELAHTPIGIVGHSEGGLIAPLAAVQSDSVAFIVLLAGPAVTGEEILYLQSELILKASGVDDAYLERSREMQQRHFAILKEEPDPAKAETKLRALYAELTEVEKQISGLTDAALDAQIAMSNSPWFRRFLTYDPRETLVKLTCPVLALFGEHDLQVPPSQSLPEMKAILEKAPSKNVTVREFPGLNHLFQHSTTGAPSEYGTIEETFAPEALDAIGGWILERSEVAGI